MATSPPVDEQSLDAAIAAIRRAGATSVAVCFLHSTSTPSMKSRRAAASGRTARCQHSRSSDVLPQIKEYDGSRPRS